MNCRSVLIVEDDIPIKEAMKALLEVDGYRVETAGNGQEAIDLLHSMPSDQLPGLILLDLMMPVMDGLTFLEFHYSTSVFLPIPVIVISANVNYVEKARLKYSVEQLRKPIDVHELFSVVRKHCGEPYRVSKSALSHDNSPSV